MRHNTAKEKLRQGQPAVGTWLSLPDPFAALHLARVGFDWLNVDLEHNPINLESAALMFLNIAQSGCVPLARITVNSEENVKRVLDVGAWGVVCPMVNTREEAERLVSYVKYMPQGIRGVGGQLRALSFGTDAATYFQRANEETLVVVQAEHIQAVENADAILSVPGIDAVFVGPNDLSASMGLPPTGDCADPRVAEAVEHIRATALAHGVAPGIHVFDGATVRRRIDEGFRFIALSSDVHFMLARAKSELAEGRQ